MHSRLLSLLVLLLATFSAPADLALTLLPSSKSGVGTNEVVFAGILTNRNATGNLFLNNIALSLNGAPAGYFTAETNVFFGNVPGILLPGEAYNDVVFAVALTAATAPGNYSGTVTISGGTNIFATASLATQTFQISLLPALAITRSGANIVLSWPTSQWNFLPQQNADLRTTNWTTMTNSPTVQNGQNMLTLLPSVGNRFYRLMY
jgi:hypothetical protein